MDAVPTPPESTKNSLRYRLIMRTRDRWPQLADLTIRHHGQFAYVDGQLSDGTTLPLFRLRYGGSANTWGFAIHLASRDGYQDSVLPSGYPSAPPKKPSTVPAASTSTTQPPGPNPRVAVGTALTGGPPAQSQRALLTHWAPTLGSGVEALAGGGCRTRTDGIHRETRRPIRFQVYRVRWLRRRSARCQCLITWDRKASTASVLPGTAK